MSASKIDKVVRDNLNALFTYAMGLVRTREDAEDLVQVTAEKALRAKKSPEEDDECRRWLFRILRNTFIDIYRKSRHLDGIEYSDDICYQSTPGANLVDILTIKQSIQRLNLEYREIIYLIDIVGFSYAEAADTLGVPIGTVMSRLSRARKSLLAIVSNSGASRVVKLERGKKIRG